MNANSRACGEPLFMVELQRVIQASGLPVHEVELALAGDPPRWVVRRRMPEGFRQVNDVVIPAATVLRAYDEAAALN